MSKFILHDGSAVAESDVTSFPDGSFRQTSTGLQVIKLIDEFLLAKPETAEQIARAGGGNPEFEAKVLTALEDIAVRIGGQTFAINQLKKAITG